MIQGKKQFSSCVSPVSYPGFISRPPYAITSFQLPSQWLSAPAHNPALSATEQCTTTGEPWSQLNPLLFRCGIVKCTKHPLLTGRNWCEIILAIILAREVFLTWDRPGALVLLSTTSGRAKEFKMSLVRCSCSVCAFDLNFSKGTNKWSNQKKTVLHPNYSKNFAQRTTCVHIRKILKLLYVAEMKKDYQAVP